MAHDPYAVPEVHRSGDGRVTVHVERADWQMHIIARPGYARGDLAACIQIAAGMGLCLVEHWGDYEADVLEDGAYVIHLTPSNPFDIEEFLSSSTSPEATSRVTDETGHWSSRPAADGRGHTRALRPISPALRMRRRFAAMTSA
ncbi:hypothetical protein Afil01_62280 [Actinorhabdospora filicis]|uniref:Uncharacterized protein n=1 Tax=Actinorhabdospora filicis TaxID=1785913 RepID=A0A9W6SS55_9ACTN|nr:hypothetical protein [Actinorhabdospora filicis]GLZ81421.1 hypothetical protein Afil01_62280 [Actinorhabdospora filicis]